MSVSSSNAAGDTPQYPHTIPTALSQSHHIPYTLPGRHCWIADTQNLYFSQQKLLFYTHFYIRKLRRKTFTSAVLQPFWHQGPVFRKTIFPQTGRAGEGGGCFRDDSSTLYLLCTLFLLLLHQLHLRSLGIRSWRLGTPDLYTHFSLIHLEPVLKEIIGESKFRGVRRGKF